MKKFYLTAISILFMAFCYGQNNCLIAYYPFDGNTNDTSGHEFNGTNNGATLTADRFGNPNHAYYFNGTSAYINIPGFDTLQSYTISAWIKEGITTNEGRIFSDGCFGCYQGSVDFGCYYDTSHNAPFIVNQNGITQSSFHGSAVVDTNWNFIVATYNDSSGIQKVFVNGVLSGGAYVSCCGWLTSPATLYQYPIYNYRIGCNGGGTSYTYFYGALDDIRVYSCALDSAAIDSLYNSGTLTGINELSPAGGISVYPNPTSGSFNLSFNSTAAGKSVKIFNTLGGLIYYLPTVKNQKQEVDLSNIPAGIYIVQVTDNDGTWIRNFIKE